MKSWGIEPIGTPRKLSILGGVLSAVLWFSCGCAGATVAILWNCDEPRENDIGIALDAVSSHPLESRRRQAGVEVHRQARELIVAIKGMAASEGKLAADGENYIQHLRELLDK